MLRPLGARRTGSRARSVPELITEKVKEPAARYRAIWRDEQGREFVEKASRARSKRWSLAANFALDAVTARVLATDVVNTLRSCVFTRRSNPSGRGRRWGANRARARRRRLGSSGAIEKITSGA